MVVKAINKTGSDEIEDRLSTLLEDYSADNAIKWLQRKFDTFDSSSREELPVGDSKNEQEYFAEIERLGYITELATDKKSSVNSPLLIVAIQMKRGLSERTSRLVQFNCAKRLLRAAVEGGRHGLTGMPAQGLFFFYDRNGRFRISLVSGEVENRRFKFNEAKRQSFFVEPSSPNNIVRRRLNPQLNTFSDVKEAFSVEALTKEFYNELFRWFEWAVKDDTGVTFPNDITKPRDRNKQLPEAIIRLITRLMFVWFIRQKEIVPNALFKKEDAGKFIIDFDPFSMEQDNYYRVILQNLFFATLNCQADKRKFVKIYHGMSNEQGVKTCYRYADELHSPDAFMELMKPVPFLNCALFDCLDKKERKQDGGREILLDGFGTKRPKQARVPNGLFFDEHNGLIKLFDQYEFTVDENNADDSDVALDPELLGKVFENLLGAFNEETKATARKATGSFYTPREIVDYMVEQSLRSYLQSKVETADDERLDDLFDRDKAAEGAAVLFGTDETRDLLNALYDCKILDPACGSGAFPMGVLHTMVRIFGRLDPSNIAQMEKIMARYREDSEAAGADTTLEEREERLNAIKNQLEEGKMYPDYARKLYLIENCIYGVDIQPIATQISKLRFFISLLCDQLRTSWNPEKDNYGLLSLPNLEAKFVCANTLLSLPKLAGGDLVMSTGNVVKLRQELQRNRHKIFYARTAKTKEKLKEKDLEIRDAIKATVRVNLTTPNQDTIAEQRAIIATAEKNRLDVAAVKMEKRRLVTHDDFFSPAVPIEVEVDINAEARKNLDRSIAEAKRLIETEDNKVNQSRSTELDDLATKVASWDPYDQNATSDFFDSEWMFNIKDGFDIVIGNPPYVEAKKLKSISAQLKTNFDIYSGTGDLSIYFIEKGLALCNKNGHLFYITTNKFFNTGYGKPVRDFILRRRIALLINFEQVEVFENVLVSSVILGIRNTESTANDHFTYERIYNLNIDEFKHQFGQRKNSFGQYNQELLDGNEWSLADTTQLALKSKIEETAARLKNIAGVSVYRGVTTGYNPAFIIDDNQKADLIAKDVKSATIIKSLLQGRNIRKWYYNESDENLLQTGYNIDIKNHYPYIYSHLYTFCADLKARSDQGANWWNLRACQYYPEFEKPEKIIWGLTADKWAFAYDNKQHYLPSNGYILTSSQVPIKYLLGIINSSLVKYYFGFIGVMTAGGAYTLKHATILELPIKIAEDMQPVMTIVDQILALKETDPKADTSKLEIKIDQLVYALYGLTEEEIALVENQGEPIVEEPITKKRIKSTKKKNKSSRSATDGEYLD